MRRSKLFIFLFLMPLLILWSCAGIRSPVPTKDLESKAAAPVQEQSMAAIEASAQAVRLAKRKMDAGEYQKATDIYAAAQKKHPHDQALLKEYVQSIEKIKNIADEVFAREDFISAGQHYAVLIKNYPGTGSPGIKISFHIDHLDEKFSISKKMISRQGFEEYRKGNLSQAIALWQALIDIDPNNPDIIKALNTAKLQQKNLQK
jgi:tetratricopeptide (TPR) repeat protein